MNVSMSSPRTTGLTTLCLLLSCRIVFATDVSQATDPNVPPPNPANISPTLSPLPGTVGPTDIGNSASTPSTMALPASSANGAVPTTVGSGAPLDAANAHKFYTFSADLRETYDDNVNTTSSNKLTALETTISPSVLVDFPSGTDNDDFSASYTFGATYYAYTTGTGDTWQYTHQFVAQLKHSFSDRFNLNVSEDFIDSPEPNIYGTTGTPFRDGQNISNAFNAGFSAQWTPLIGSQTTYTNTLVRYLDNPSAAIGQNNDENTASQSISYTVTPTINVSLGGIYDNVTYESIARGYTSYTGFIGGGWQALPNVNASLRVGGSITDSEQQQLDGTVGTVETVSPYVDLSGSWQIGSRSSLQADYTHETSPSDYVGSSAQESDRVSGTFNYAVTPQLSTHLQLSYSNNVVSQTEVFDTTLTNGYTETVYAVDAGASYNFVKYFSLTFDITSTGVSSELPDQNYTRDQVSFGVRGTY